MSQTARLTFGSVCSGIGAPEVAWAPLGWRCAFVSEIDRFPRAVLEHRLGAGSANGPRLFGDFTRITGADVDEPIDLLVGGTPCQSFSVAGKRLGLDDPRGNLALEYLALARRLRPRWLVYENVPGLLSSDDGRDFGAFLGLMGECGYGFAYRVLDAQFAGVPQRRRRVFVVGHLGDWRRAAAVLLEPESLRGDSPPRREAGEGVAPSLTVGTGGSSAHRYAQAGMEGSLIARCLTGSNSRIDGESETFIAHAVTADQRHAHPENGRGTLIAHSLRADGFDASEDGTGRGTPLVPIAFAQNQLGEVRCGGSVGTLNTNSNASGRNTPMIAFSAKDHGADAGELSPTLRAGGHADSHANAGVMPAVAFSVAPGARELKDDLHIAEIQATKTLDIRGSDPGMHQGGTAVVSGYAVRRLTPRECERLQGLPDDWTLIPYNGKPAKDGPRYKAIGNSMAVPVISWIGQRIELVDAFCGTESHSARPIQTISAE